MRVLDLSQQLPGPYTSALLRDLGAHVTKIEPPAGDPSRTLDPDMYRLVNAGKDVIKLDLKTPGDVGRLHRMVADADVFIEGFRPGVVSRIGADWSSLSRVNPRLVYCAISACGQSGPCSGVPMHDLNLQAMAGIDPGQGIGVPWVDLGTATTSALAIVAAWANAQRTGAGRFLDVAMLDTAALWGRVKASATGRLEPTYGTFETADGAKMALAILEDHIWPRLCEAMGWEDWLQRTDLRTYERRVLRAEEINGRLADGFRRRTGAELTELARRHDLPLNPVGSPVGTDSYRQLAERGLIATGRTTPVPGRLANDAPARS